MSDGMTDCARDQERGERLEAYFNALYDHVCSGFKKHEEIMRAAEAVDSVQGGYFSCPTRLASRVGLLGQNLQAGDKVEWLKLLRTVREDESLYTKFKTLSPFKDSLMIHFIDVSVMRYSELSRELSDLFHKKVKEDLGITTDLGDKFAMAQNTSGYEVFFLWSSTYVPHPDGTKGRYVSRAVMVRNQIEEYQREKKLKSPGKKSA